MYLMHLKTFFLRRGPQVTPDPQRSPWHEKG